MNNWLRKGNHDAARTRASAFKDPHPPLGKHSAETRVDQSGPLPTLVCMGMGLRTRSSFPSNLLDHEWSTTPYEAPRCPNMVAGALGPGIVRVIGRASLHSFNSVRATTWVCVPEDPSTARPFRRWSHASRTKYSSVNTPRNKEERALLRCKFDQGS